MNLEICVPTACFIPVFIPSTLVLTFIASHVKLSLYGYQELLIGNPVDSSTFVSLTS